MNHIHDRFFKAAFSQPGVVASLITDLFPLELSSVIDTDSLHLTNDSYVDDELNEHLADLVYECQFRDGTPFTVALLLEHKSYTEPHPHLQLLRYMLNRWQEDLDHKRKLTPIVPVIIYHGASRWIYKPLEQSLAGINEALRRYVPDFDYVLIDLSVLPDEQIQTFQSRFLQLSATLMKYQHRTKLFERIVAEVIAQQFNSLPEDEQRRVVDPILVYILERTDFTQKNLIAIFTEATKNPVVMNGLERLRLEGRLEGRAETARKFVKGALKLGMDAKTIADTFEMDIKEVEEIVNWVRQENA